MWKNQVQVVFLLVFKGCGHRHQPNNIKFFVILIQKSKGFVPYKTSKYYKVTVESDW